MLDLSMTRSIFKFIVVSCLVLCAAVALTPLVLGQAMSPISGRVTSDDGHPLAGVRIYGRLDSTTTDDHGEFHLAHPGTVVHFSKKAFQPKTLVLRTEPSEVLVTMDSKNGDVLVPTCGRKRKGDKRIGWGNVRFLVTVEAQIEGGTLDVDYVKYFLTPPHGRSYLEFWFGPYAISLEPNDQPFMDSVGFSQRYLAGRDGSTFGEDSRGHLKTGGDWRQAVFFMTGGAIYRNAPPEDAKVFDQIIDSMCVVPYRM